VIPCEFDENVVTELENELLIELEWAANDFNKILDTLIIYNIE